MSRKQNIIHYRKSIYFLEINSRKKQKLQNLTFEKIKKYKDDIFKLYKDAYKLVDIAKELNIGRDFVASVIEIYREFL